MPFQMYVFFVSAERKQRMPHIYNAGKEVPLCLIGSCMSRASRQHDLYKINKNLIV